jgi:hypothetical protein
MQGMAELEQRMVVGSIDRAAYQRVAGWNDAIENGYRFYQIQEETVAEAIARYKYTRRD